jgi:hypothetical protein
LHAVFGAPVKEAAVDKYGDPCPSEDDVREDLQAVNRD